MRKLLITAGLAVALFVSVIPASANHVPPTIVTHNYSATGGTDILSVSLSGDIVTVGGTTVRNVGGAQFAIRDTGELVDSVSISDASGDAVSWTACQDTNGNRLCGEEGEPSVEGCSTGGDLSEGFDPALVITVFVRTAAVGVVTSSDTCLNLGTSGSISVTYITPEPEEE